MSPYGVPDRAKDEVNDSAADVAELEAPTGGGRFWRRGDVTRIPVRARGVHEFCRRLIHIKKEVHRAQSEERGRRNEIAKDEVKIKRRE